jgi:hypothetical protein
VAAATVAAAAQRRLAGVRANRMAHCYGAGEGLLLTIHNPSSQQGPMQRSCIAICGLKSLTDGADEACNSANVYIVKTWRNPCSARLARSATASLLFVASFAS